MYLDRIVADKQEEVKELKERVTSAELERRIAGLPACRGFERALHDRKRGMGLIAEVKKASPSKGLIRADFDPVTLAQAYERAGTDCISVLTDVKHFQGAADYLTLVREAVKVPLLRKDFTIDEMQVLEARVIGADAILLIAAILTDAQLKSLHRLAKDIGMDVLVEVHDREELERVLEQDVSLVGINNRNLKTFVTDLAVTEQLIPIIPKGKMVVSESGISAPAEINRLYDAGSRAVLIGEHFMRQPNVEEAVFSLMGPLASERSGS
ncbi:indole-3-glycerol phosphate synthase TrpC [Paenibacillus turpanensis]|uniref:indole-3-glycerol phosphate synthase TrpC n=1 Tax=Paenibacillus turpanensis TaxID=2689078 RepID=UPI001407EDCF|nr:indole-3-glycerol phosphate synthase TrpC [Paenibacillus turpanensis]